MKFQWIGTGPLLARMAIFPMLLLAGASAHAVDEDMPPPADVDIPAPKSSVGPEKQVGTNPLREDESIPAPSIGDESLPEPSVDRGQERAKNQVNKAPSDDEIFLPTPNVNDNVYYAPVGTPAPHVTQEDLDWRNLNYNRPMFSLYAGGAFKSYINNGVQQNWTPGEQIGLSLRALSLGQALFLHAFAAYSFFNVGDVGTVSNIHDTTFHAGGMLELGLGRRFSIYGSLLRRQSLASSPSFDGKSTDPVAKPYNFRAADADGIGEAPNWNVGVGAQWDFYVIPHGSLGVHLHVEQNIYALTLSMAIEPAPREKFSLNYEKLE